MTKKNQEFWQFNNKKKIIGNKIYYANIAYDSKERAEYFSNECSRAGYNVGWLTQVSILKRKRSKKTWWAVYIHKPLGY